MAPESLTKEPWFQKWLAGAVVFLASSLYGILTVRISHTNKDVDKVWEKLGTMAEDIAFIKGKMEGKKIKQGRDQ